MPTEPHIVYANTGISVWRGMPLNNDVMKILATIDQYKTEVRNGGFTFHGYAELHGRCSMMVSARATPQVCSHFLRSCNKLTNQFNTKPYRHEAEICEVHRPNESNAETNGSSTTQEAEYRKLHWPGADPCKSEYVHLQLEEDSLLEGDSLIEFPFRKTPITPRAQSRPLYIYEALTEYLRILGLPYNLPQTFVAAEHYLNVINPDPKFLDAFMKWAGNQEGERWQKAAGHSTVNMADIDLRTPHELRRTARSLCPSSERDSSSPEMRVTKAEIVGILRKRQASGTPTRARKHRRQK